MIFARTQTKTFQTAKAICRQYSLTGSLPKLPHTVLSLLVGPNDSVKTTIIEALALLFGRDRLVRRLTEHDFHGSAPDETGRILCFATVSGFEPNDPHHHPTWFNPERGVEKWYDRKAKTLRAAPDAQHMELAVQIGFAA